MTTRRRDTPTPGGQANPYLAKARRLAGQRNDLLAFSDKPAELVGVLATEAAYQANLIQLLLDGNVVTREKLTELRDRFKKDQQNYAQLADDIRQDRVSWNSPNGDVT